jgi:predicted nucleic-acid-binding Zn-ribbon protein
MSRPKFKQETDCSKCGLYYDHKVSYSPGFMAGDGAPVGEHLVRTCRRCGYEWEEACCN